MAFAIQNGNFGSASTWDTGIVPTGSEAAYSNNFTIQVDTSITPNILANTANPYYLPNTATPVMTSATSPSGQVFWSTQGTNTEAWRAFDRNTVTGWQTSANVPGFITYQFPSARIIRRYSFRAIGALNAPRAFTFQGSMDNITWTDGIGGNPRL